MSIEEKILQKITEISDLKVAITFLINNGLKPCLVGGTVRDFILTNELGNDWDIEIQSLDSEEISEKSWLKIIENVTSKLSQELNATLKVHPMGVNVLELGKISLEISSARTETYNLSNGPSFGHSDFSYKLESSLDFKETFKRRDFTCNAIGIHFFKVGPELRCQIINPYNGISDIEQKILNSVNSDTFFYDPVRFLRMVRFRRKLDFSYSDSLLLNLVKFDLSKITAFYITKESFKSDFFGFMQEFFDLISKHNIKIPQVLQRLDWLVSCQISLTPRNPLEGLFALVAFSCKTATKLNLDDYVAYFGLSKSLVKKMLDIFKSKEQIKKNSRQGQLLDSLEKKGLSKEFVQEVQEKYNG